MPLLDWVNRNQAEETATSTPYHLLKFENAYGDAEHTKENLIIQGDNLQALKALLPLYGGQVKCIFIDPPYNTQSAFEHYDDKLEHAQWLSMMYPRLQLLKELLAEDGSIWITLDDNEAHYMKVLCDEVFSRKNFVTTIAWQKIYTTKNSAKFFSSMHDHVLIYSKNIDEFILNDLPREDKQNLAYKNPDNDERGPWKATPIHARNFYSLGRYSITTPRGRVIDGPPTGTYWRISEENFIKMDQDNRIWWGQSGNGIPAQKRFLSEVRQGVTPNTFWTFSEAGHNGEAKNELRSLLPTEEDLFLTPKPEKLIQRIIQLATSKNDLVLDSFLGSGTTSAVAHKMGRRYIGIEMGEHAKTFVIPRLEKVIAGEQGGISKAVNWQGGGGFSFYTLGNPVFDDQGFLNADVHFKDLASYVWWLETKTALNQTESFDNPYLGTHDGVAYYLLYNGILRDRRPNGGNVLTLSILNYLNECHAHEGKRVVIGEASRLGDARLEALEIEFKQIPYSLYGNQAQ